MKYASLMHGSEIIGNDGGRKCFRVIDKSQEMNQMKMTTVKHETPVNCILWRIVSVMRIWCESSLYIAVWF